MSINQLVIETLETLNVPVSFQKYQGNETTYITFFQYSENGYLFSDDNEEQTRYFIQVDVWSKNDYMDLVEDVKNALENNGFKRLNLTHLYETDTQIYHCAIRFSYVN